MYNPQASNAITDSIRAQERDYISESLTAALKRSTRSAHRRAETTGVIRQLVRRQADRAAYVSLLRNLYPVYRALEHRLGALQRAPAYAVIANPALYRSRSIEQDLRRLAGNDWQSSLARLPAARVYAQRIETADESKLLAHAYVRYLGDLNGGQIIKRLLRDSLELDDCELSYYDFDGIDDASAYGADFKQSLDALSATHAPAAIVAEALIAFRLATELSIAIEASLKTG